MIPDSERETIFGYVGYATGAQMWGCIKEGLVVWGGLGVFLAILLLVSDAVLGPPNPERFDGIPEWVQLVGTGALAWWVTQGWTVPRVTLRQLLFCVAVVILAGAAVAALPPVIHVIPLAWAMAVFRTADEINKCGKENFETLSSSLPETGDSN